MSQVDERREGRGRLSKLDMLPEEAQPDLVWLNQELRANTRPQIELLDIFNGRLAGHGIEPISKSSFSRYTVRKAIQFKELDATMRMSRELADMLGTDSADKLTITLSNLLQVTAVKLIEAEGSTLAAKDLMELGKAGQAAVSAQKQSADYRRLLESEFAKRMEAAADRAETVAREAGVSAQVIADLRRKVLGV